MYMLLIQYSYWNMQPSKVIPRVVSKINIAKEGCLYVCPAETRNLNPMTRVRRVTSSLQVKQIPCNNPEMCLLMDKCKATCLLSETSTEFSFFIPIHVDLKRLRSAIPLQITLASP